MISASRAAFISSCAPSRATSSKISGSCLSEANSSSMWPRMRSAGDTRSGMGMGMGMGMGGFAGKGFGGFNGKKAL